MKNYILIILSVLFLTACNSKPTKEMEAHATIVSKAAHSFVETFPDIFDPSCDKKIEEEAEKLFFLDDDQTQFIHDAKSWLSTKRESQEIEKSRKETDRVIRESKESNARLKKEIEEIDQETKGIERSLDSLNKKIRGL